MQFYDHDNATWCCAGDNSWAGAWQRCCGALFVGDTCPACRENGFYTRYMAAKDALFAEPVPPVVEPSIVVTEMPTAGEDVPPAEESNVSIKRTRKQKGQW